jgi:hypothetical protein
LSSLAIACLVFGCTLAGTILGMLLQRVLPGHHLSGESKDAVKNGLALIATLTALVLGLLVATTKGTYDAQSAAVKELAANVALLDRALARYGPQTKECRELIPKFVGLMVEQIWPDGSEQPGQLTGGDVRLVGEAMFDRIAELEPKTDAQRTLKSKALEIAINLAQTRQRMLAQKESSVPTPFLLVLGFWLTILFLCYGLLAPRNLTVFLVLIVCMLSVAGAILLVLEMDRPFEGIIRVPSAPLREVVSRLGQ